VVRLLAVLVASLLLALPARAADPQVVQVAPRIYALVGDLGQRSAANLGNNATFAAVVTEAGVVLIDSGGSKAGAQRLESVIKTITDQPVVAVINTGGQDHRWFGNAWFKGRGARLIAATATVADQKARLDQQVDIARRLIGEGFAGTEPVTADETFDGDTALKIGGVVFELRPVGPAHTPGDTLVWLPDARVMISGDVVFTDRLLGVMPYSSTKGWTAAFLKMAAFNPRAIIPGHGNPSDLSKAYAETFDYLTWLRRSVGKLIAGGGDMQAAAGLDQGRFLDLVSAKDLAGRNAQQVFSEMEFE
jgi:glyoxylase-like metal-dependent hydrolase (beta-lactamase superfamily II)